MSNNGTRVLVVDDESAIRDVLSRTLDDEGYDCSVAASVDEALDAVNRNSPDLILSDIMMPGRTGIELLEEVRRVAPDTAIIMVTAMADSQTAINAMKLGAFDYVTKPFNLVEVLLSVERALEKRALLITNREYRIHLELKVEEQTSVIRETYLGAVKALAEALEAKDPYTRGHSMRVTEVSVTLAREMGLGLEMIERIRLAALVHDIGKIGVPEEVLHKPGKLMDEEYEAIKTHPTVGERILRPVIKDQVVLDIVFQHHERYSGGGYPRGRSRDEICLGARLLSVADAYDAMTSTRPYRCALSPEKAEEQLLANRGTQFDPEIVDLFISIKDKMPFCPMSGAPSEAREKSCN